MKKNKITLSLLLSFYIGIAQNDIKKDTTALKEIMVFGNRLQIPISKENRNIQILDQIQIKVLPVRTTNELLSYISGVDLRQRGPFGTQADVSIDGGSPEQTLILINGVKILDNQTAHNVLNIPIPIEMIERIEVLRGPAARIYGINSLTGVINIVTKIPEKSGVFVQTYAGSNFQKDDKDSGDLFNSRGIQFGGVIKNETYTHQLYGSHDSGTGYRYNTAFHNNKILYQGNVTPNVSNSVNILAGTVGNSFGANGFYAAPGDKDSKEIVNTALVSVGSKHYLTDQLILAPRVSYRYNYDDYQYYRQNTAIGRSQHYSNAFSSELNGSYITTVGVVGMGVELRHENIHSTNIGEHERDNYGMYTEFKTELTAKLIVNFGTYLNYNSGYSSWKIFPGIDASYTVSDLWKVIFNTGSSQRIPSFTDLYLNQRPGNIGNPNLSTEQAYQVESGFKYNKNALSISFISFYRTIDNYIHWIRNSTKEPYQAQNIKKNETYGISFNSRYNFSSNSIDWNFGLEYTYLNLIFDQPSVAMISKYALESLRHQVVATVNMKYKDISVLLANRYNERMSYKSYFLTDLRISHAYRQFNFYLDAQNLFDVTYIEVGAIPMPGRWISLGVKLNTLF